MFRRLLLRVYSSNLIGHFFFFFFALQFFSFAAWKLFSINMRLMPQSTSYEEWSNVQPEITDLFLPGLNVTVPNWRSKQLVILVIEDYALNRVGSRTVLSLVCVIRHDLDAHKATRPAMFRVITCHLWSGLSRNCRESKLLRGRAKNKCMLWRWFKTSCHRFPREGKTYHVVGSLTRMSVRQTFRHNFI